MPFRNVLVDRGGERMRELSECFVLRPRIGVDTKLLVQRRLLRAERRRVRDLPVQDELFAGKPDVRMFPGTDCANCWTKLWC